MIIDQSELPISVCLNIINQSQLSVLNNYSFHMRNAGNIDKYLNMTRYIICNIQVTKFVHKVTPFPR